MDSKLKRQVIFAVTAIVICVIALVFAANYISTGSFFPESKSTKKSTQISNKTEENETAGSDLAQKYDLNPKKDPYAFLADPEFFDKEENSKQAEVERKSKELSVLVNSVDKDLRITIINNKGELVAGEGFEVVLEQMRSGVVEKSDKYKDLDQDGYLYIGDMKPGEYQVAIEPVDKFIVPAKVPVTVKEEISYTLIDDISYLIKSEADIDPKLEDTEVNDALKEADKTEKTEAIRGESTGFGIDVSKWNKKINWDRVKADGVDFVIIRCGYRGSSTGALVEDPYFKQNIDGAAKAGIKVGIYFFTQAVNEAEAVEEASMVLTLCKGSELAFPIFIDTEGAGGNGRADKLEKGNRTAVCKAFCQTIENAGFNAGIYASKNWFRNNLDMTQLEDYYIWLAEYKGSPTYEASYDMWQYTSSGTVDGIEGRVDLNISYVGF